MADHRCLAADREYYEKEAQGRNDDTILSKLKAFENSLKGRGRGGLARGGSYDTPPWRLYKQIYRLEAQRRGLI